MNSEVSGIDRVGGQAVPGVHRIVVMGVSGCGKSSVASGIAAGLGLRYVDGDDLHTAANVEKMRAGVPLTDDDRWPWLDRIAATLVDAAALPSGAAIACSALRRVYRDRIRAAVPGLRFVHLSGGRELILSRMARREGHYMPTSLLDSQLRTLEVPGADESDVMTLDIADSVEGLVARALEALRAA